MLKRAVEGDGPYIGAERCEKRVCRGTDPQHTRFDQLCRSRRGKVTAKMTARQRVMDAPAEEPK